MNKAKPISLMLVLVMLFSCFSGYGAFVPNDAAWNDDPGIPGNDDFQWGPEQMFADNAWDLTDEDTLTNPGCKDIIVAIPDTGVQAAHEDITPDRIWRNFDEILNNQDDDGNGYIDDLFGYDFVNDDAYDSIDDVVDYGYDNSIPVPNPPIVDTYHGTHIAGIIAAKIDNNEIGIAGIAQVKIMVLRVVREDRFVKGLEDAIEYAINKGADVISCSISSDPNTNPPPDSLDFAIAWAESEEVVWVNNAGNKGNKVPPDVRYPANKETVVSVGASEPDEVDGVPYNPGLHRAGYSSYGPGLHLDVLAPGGAGSPFDDNDIYSTWGPNTDDYSYGAGTSMAAPHAAATVALMMAYHQDMSAERYRQLLKATALDITPSAGPRQDTYDDLSGIMTQPGLDEPTGWGEVDAQAALGYANSIRNRWSTEMKVKRDVSGFGEENTPAIAVDSEGYSHIVWVGIDTQIYYTSVDPAGREWCPPKSLEAGLGISNTPSKYPDVYIDSSEGVHVCWIEEDVNQDDVYYVLLTTKGLAGNPVQATNTQTTKECTNILTDRFGTPMIIFAEDNGAPTGWDLERLDPVFGGWNQVALVNTIDNQRKPSADIGENAGVNYIYCTYEEHDGNDDEIWVYTDFPGVNPNPWQITDDVDADSSPNIAILYDDMSVYVTWLDIEGVRLYAFEGADVTQTTIHYPVNYNRQPQHEVGIMVGNFALKANLQFPKVSVSQISDSHGRPDARDLVQVNVVWGELLGGQWDIRLSELTVDGRSMTEDNARFLFPTEVTNPHAIASSQKRSTTRTDWLDTDGNFRLIMVRDSGGPPNPGQGEVGQEPPGGGGGPRVVNELWFISTRERWEEPSYVGNLNQPWMDSDPDIFIDEMNNLHIVYASSIGFGPIMYMYWDSQSRPPLGATTGPIRISPLNHQCSLPTITVVNNQVMIVYYNKERTEVWFTRLDPITESIYMRGKLGCSDGFDFPVGDIRISNDFAKGHIGVVWSEDVPGRNTDIKFGVVDYENNLVQEETNTLVQGSEEPDITPSLDISADGTFYVAYERSFSNDIYYNGIEEDPLGGYLRKFDNDKKVDDNIQQDDSMKPCIRADKSIHRRNENNQKLGNNPNHYVHIVYCRKLAVNEYTLTYTMKDSEGNTVITEKDVTALPTNRNLYFSDVPIKGRVVLNRNNQVAIVYAGKIHHGLSWDPLHNNYAVFFTKLDHNGEILTVETHISDDLINDCKSPEAAYDQKDFLNVVWQKEIPPNQRICFSWENAEFQ